MSNVLSDVRLSRAVRRGNTRQFELLATAAQLNAALAVTDPIMKAKNDKAVMPFVGLTINGYTVPEDTTVADLKNRLTIPKSFEEKVTAFGKFIIVGETGLAIAAIYYTAMADQNPDTDEILLRTYPKLTSSFLFSLREIAEGRLHPYCLVSPSPITEAAMQARAPVAAVDEIAKAKALLAPVVIKKDGVERIEVRQLAPAEISHWSAQFVVTHEGIQKDRNKLKQKAEQYLAAKKIRARREWFCKDGKLYIGNHAFTRERFERMATEFYTHLGDASGLENLLRKNQIVKSK